MTLTNEERWNNIVVNKDEAIDYINELLNSEYHLMQDRKLDTSNPSLYDEEGTEDEIKSIENAQKFMEGIQWTEKLHNTLMVFWLIGNAY